MYRQIIFLVSILLICTQSFAGFDKLTFHSRANCINNESISWHFGHSYMLHTISWHENKLEGGHHHYVDTGWHETWRSAAVCWNEAPITKNNWTVLGFHYMKIDGKEKLLQEEISPNCDIYNGWWDV